MFMATLIIDIETAPLPWDSFDTHTQKNFGVVSQSGEYVAPDNLGLSPYTGHTVAIGVHDLERNQSAVYYCDEDAAEDWEDDCCKYKPRSEREMLEDFWEGAKDYNVFATFAGRMFDVPFLNIRSAVHGITPTQDLMQHRYLRGQVAPYHVDLQDELSYYGSVGKKVSLHTTSVALGIESSKTAGVSGKDIAEFFLQKKFRDIARYNARDILATAELYKKWYEHLAPQAFKNIEK